MVSTRPVQLSLFPVCDAERDLLRSSPRYRAAGEDERRFAVAWLELLRECPDRPSVPAIAERAGVCRTRGYELAKSGEVARLLREAAQAHGDGIADVAGSLAYDLLCLDALRRVADGRLNAGNVPAATVRLLEGAAARLGRDPRMAVLVASEAADGARRAALVEGSGSALDAILGRLGVSSKLGDGGVCTDGGGVEHGVADFVRREVVAETAGEGGDA